MGKLYEEEKKQLDSSIRTTTEIKQPEVLRKPVPAPLQDIKGKKSGEKPGRLNSFNLQDADEEYFEKLLQNGEQDSLVMKISEISESEEKNQINLRSVKGDFRQAAPVAKKRGFFEASENNAVTRCRKTFIHADLCTARELDRMKDYLDKRKEVIPAMERGKDKAHDPVLDKYVDKILSTDIKESCFTDAYLSMNIHKLYEYCRNIQQYEGLKEKYPAFFESLPEEKKVILESRVRWGRELGGIIRAHLHLHGIELEQDKDGKLCAALRKESEKNDNKRELEKASYDKKLKAFINNNFREEQLRLTEVVTGNKELGAEETVMALEKRIALDQKTASICGDELRSAVGEIRRILQIRDVLIQRAGEFKAGYDKAASEKEKDGFGEKITRINASILYASRCADHYRDFVDFLLGEKDRVSPETAGFIVKSGKEDLINILVLKDMGDCVKDTITATQRMAVMKEIAALKKSNSDPRRLKELEDSLDGSLAYQKRSREDFLSTLEAYKEAKEKKALYDSLMAENQNNINMANDFGVEMAEKYHLNKMGGRVFRVNYNPFGTVENYKWMHLAMDYEPTDETPENIKKEIAEKGVKPLLQKFLSMKPEDVANLELKGEPDLTDPDFWQNLSLLKTGFVMPEFINVAERHNITLTREEYTHLITLGRVINNNVGGYDRAVRKVRDPMNSLLDAPEFEGRGMKLYEEVFSNLHNRIKLKPEIEKVFAKYSKEKLGYTRKPDGSAREENMPMIAAHYTMNKYNEYTDGLRLDARKLYDSEYPKIMSSSQAQRYKTKEETEAEKAQKEAAAEEENIVKEAVKEEAKNEEPVKEENAEEEKTGADPEILQEEEKEQAIQENKEDRKQEEKEQVIQENKKEDKKKETGKEENGHPVLQDVDEINVMKTGRKKTEAAGNRCDTDYSEFLAASRTVGTKIGFFTSRDMTYVKKYLSAVLLYLDNSNPGGLWGDYEHTKTTFITTLNHLEDACNNYCLRKQRERKTRRNDSNYRNVDNLMRQLPKLRLFYSSLSSERYNSLRARGPAFGDLMAKNEELNEERPQEKRKTDVNVLKFEYASGKMMLDSLTVRDTSAPDGVSAGGADGIYRNVKALDKLLKKSVPADPAGFFSSRNKIVEGYERIISACSAYSIAKTPHFSRGKKRLDTVRKLMGIYQRERDFLLDAAPDSFMRNEEKELTWDKVFSRGLINTGIQDVEGPAGDDDDNRIETLPVRDKLEQSMIITLK